MKNVFFLLMASAMLTVSCKKNDECAYTESPVSASAAERAYLRSYFSTNSIVAVEHTSGVFYTINNPGTGTSPSICSNIVVKYTGKLLTSGTQFDASTNPAGAILPLGQLIPGWQKALPILKTGGSITLYIPPSLGYGNQDVRNPPLTGPIIIPADSYLKFDIELLNVQ
jgi:FKBP-type peptidyl-prolyl cis-trans isomerase FkpA